MTIMTDNTRALLEQALDVIIANTTGKDDLEAAIRSELAKPVEHETCGHCGRRVIDAPWPVRKTAVAPAWHDAPTCAGVWHVKTHPISSPASVIEVTVQEGAAIRGVVGSRWLGPIPQDKEGGAE